MFKGKLRTKFLLSVLLVITALTCATLLIVRDRVRLRVRGEILEALRNSVVTFQNFRHQREVTLAQAAGLVASLPNLGALMTTQHEPTIHDASTYFWRKIGSDLFLLANRVGKVVALHTTTAGFTSSEAQQFLRRSLGGGETRDWWFGNGHLYEVFLQPIYFGSPANNSLLGVLAVGYEVDNRLADEVSRIASSQVAFRYGKSIVLSTLPATQQSELSRQSELLRDRAALGPLDIQLGEERFLSTSVDLAPGSTPTVSLSVLKSYDQATAFLEKINHMLLGLGLAAILVGSALVFLISDTFTRPLADLVAGVRALEKGDYAYPLAPHGADEVSELTGAFDRMRRSLQKTQQELLDAERLATIGRMASSISHDLRHPLTAFLAYSEFLLEENLDEQQRRDLYQEIRLAVNRMTDLISSLLEFSKAREELRPTLGNLEETIQGAIQTVRARPEFRRITVTLSHEGESRAWFDAVKLERVFHNLLLNACEAVPPDSGKIELSTRRTGEALEIRVADNGSGIPEVVRDIVFEPFVTYGKQNGTGLGLAVVQKIIQDHGGQVRVESTGPTGTVFKLTLPLKIPPGKVPGS
jgi:signal transduction histidine kinase